ncbi:MAG: response regulator [Anaerolineales bacterium]
MSTLKQNQVVIAEDDQDISYMIQSYFERVFGLSVQVTDSVDEILPLVLRTRASVLIMDLELSDGDATPVLEDVAGIEGLIVVILTGTWKRCQESKLLEEGAYVVMRKPQKARAIWQQVLNLRRTGQKTSRPSLVKVRGKDSYYDMNKGVVVTKGRRTIYLADTQREILDLLAKGLSAQSEDMTEQTQDESEGWVRRRNIIRSVYGEDESLKSVEGSFWYQMREVKKRLEDCVGGQDGQDVIENKRVGRSVSYYRLNPNLFRLTMKEKV